MDTLTKTGALKLSKDIERYWIRKGYVSVKTTVDPFIIDQYGHKLYQVRSNLVNGLPV